MNDITEPARLAVYRGHEAVAITADLAHLYRLDQVRRGAAEPDQQVAGFLDELAATTARPDALIVTAGVDSFLVGFVVATPEVAPPLRPDDEPLDAYAIRTVAHAHAASRALPGVVTALLDEVARHAPEGRLWITVPEQETSDVRLYRSLGWRDAPPPWAGVDDDAVLLAPALAGSAGHTLHG